jgi:hypothetical protein
MTMAARNAFPRKHTSASSKNTFSIGLFTRAGKSASSLVWNEGAFAGMDTLFQKESAGRNCLKTFKIH